ncbi:LacI family DNA-binding transcriptional regulator [Vibrio cyclitrophicus]|uniref:LacI family DNA-binding transcriptional regulator n=1 Tax=Vibrio cyclitrophicus TaxID=47951 RepID=UPI0002E3F71B|nr:LacI family DNA-binding transcriptional regulator [Vibrio cyclitrophicus]
MVKKNIPVTLSDVARLAGVSKAVASRALSGKNRPISADKKARVLEAAESLGYVANPFAQSLSSNETGLIAIVVNHISDVSDLTLFDSLIQAIQSIGKQALFVRLQSLQDIDDLQKNAFIQRVDAALILSDLIEPELAESLFYTNNVIMLNGKSQELGYSVKVNEEPGIKSAIAHARNRGITQAVLIAGRKSSANEADRVSHYLNHFNQNKIELVSSAFCNYSYDDALAHLNASDIKNNESIAIFCTSDSMAMAAVDYLKAKNIDAYSHRIFGFDNTEFSRRGDYQFSTIGFDKNEFVQAIIAVITQAQTQIIGNTQTENLGSSAENLESTSTDNKKWLTNPASHLTIKTQFYLNQS